MGTKELWRRLRWYFIHMGPQRDVTLETANGLLTFDSKDWLIGKYLYVKRAHEVDEIRGVTGLLQSEGYLRAPLAQRAVLNAGAHIGMTCIALIKLAGFGRAAAFEPAPNNYRFLTRNVQQNGLGEKIRCFQLALSSAEGELNLEFSKDNSGDHRIRLVDRPGFFGEEDRPTVKVRASTLDRLMVEEPSLQEAKFDLVWVDVQGHEGHFFRGARHFFERGIPAVIEFWPYGIDRSGMSRGEFCQIVSELFTNFYVGQQGSYQRHLIAEIEGLFDAYNKPREMCLIVLVKDP